MPQERLTKGGYPPKTKLQPVRGADGVWRLDRVRHRAYNGEYVRSSGSGYTKKECLADWEANFERNRNKGRVIRGGDEAELTLDSLMKDAFDLHFKQLRRKVSRGKLTQQTYDCYHLVTYKADDPKKAKKDAVKLESEMGHLTIGEAGKSKFLADYLNEIYEIAPGIAGTHYVVLCGTFSTLTLEGLFDYSPMLPVPRPERSEPNQRALTFDEIDLLGELLIERRRRARYFRPYMLTMLATGMRPMEAAALRWCDVVFLPGGTAVVYVGATMIKGKKGRGVYRQEFRKHGGGHGKGGAKAYFVTLPKWAARILLDWKDECAPASDDLPVFMNNRGTFVSPCSVEYVLDRTVAGTELDWMTFGNLRDTVATHVAGRTGDPRRASAQLGHVEGASVATRHYIDRNGYKHEAVDNTDVLEELEPLKTGAKLESRHLAAVS